ncbi:MAG TPA: hypothetical protein VMU47_09060 [Caldimonas sp.]|nr:hypothetical protein [Caldimonas sp.]
MNTPQPQRPTLLPARVGAPTRLRHASLAVVRTVAIALTVGLAGCWGGSDDTATTTTFSVGGTVSGLTTSGLVLANGNDTAAISSGATGFTFANALAAGTPYAVTVQAQPANAMCTVAGGSGSIGTAAVTTVAVTCAPLFAIGGSISGLSAAGLVLANGTDSVAVASGSTGFTLPTSVAQGASYTVTVQTQPAGEHCSLVNSTGTVAAANVTNVAVACAASSHTLGGTISGLASSGLVLGNGSDTLSPASGALAFTFALPVADGGAYAVSVKTQPTGETCSVGSGSGTMGNSNLSTVAITCSPNAYRVGGAITGLTSAGLILANGTDTVSPAVNASSYTFGNRVAFGGSYSVTVQQQPAGLTCSVSVSFPATMGAGDVTNDNVTCAPATGLQVVAGRLSCPTPAAVDGTGAAASVPAGEGMLFDAAGNLFLMGRSTDVLREMRPTGTVSTLAGLYHTTGNADGTGSNARFDQAVGIAADNLGNVYVIEAWDVRRITPTGVVTTFAGVQGNTGFADGTGPAAQFSGASAIVTDPAGNAYIADANNNVIRQMTPGAVVTTFVGGGGPGGKVAGYVDGTGTSALFNAPQGLALDASGNLYVADTGNSAIRKVTPSGVVTTLAGGAAPGAPGFADGTGSGARFFTPTELANAPSGGLYVLDQGTQAVRLVSASGVVTTLGKSSGATPTGAIASSIFAMPSNAPGIAADATGSLYLSLGCAIQKVGP